MPSKAPAKNLRESRGKVDVGHRRQLRPENESGADDKPSELSDEITLKHLPLRAVHFIKVEFLINHLKQQPLKLIKSMKKTLHNIGTKATLLTAALLFAAGGLQAQVIVNPTGVTSTSTDTINLRTPSMMTDGLRLTDGGSTVETGDTIPVTMPGWAPVGDGSSGYSASINAWRTEIGITTATLTFNLNTAYDLAGVYLWNYAETTGGISYNIRGANGITASFSTSGTGGTFSNSQSFNLAIAPDSFSPTGTITPAQYFAFSGLPTGVDAVKFDITSNHGSSNLTGLGQVRFTTVPEPGTAALTALGLGAMAMVFVRRRPRN